MICLEKLLYEDFIETTLMFAVSLSPPHLQACNSNRSFELLKGIRVFLFNARLQVVYASFCMAANIPPIYPFIELINQQRMCVWR